MDPQLLAWLAACKDDPEAFALGAFPWGEPGTILEHAALDEWQIHVLRLLKHGLIDVVRAELDREWSERSRIPGTPPAPPAPPESKDKPKVFFTENAWKKALRDG